MKIRHPAMPLCYAPPLRPQRQEHPPHTVTINVLVLIPPPRGVPPELPAPPLDIVRVEEGGGKS